LLMDAVEKDIRLREAGTLLDFYGLYKQALLGDNITAKPWFGEALFKWNAWTKYKGYERKRALAEWKEKYNALFTKYPELFAPLPNPDLDEFEPFPFLNEIDGVGAGERGEKSHRKKEANENNDDDVKQDTGGGFHDDGKENSDETDETDEDGEVVKKGATTSGEAAQLDSKHLVELIRGEMGENELISKICDVLQVKAEQFEAAERLWDQQLDQVERVNRELSEELTRLRQENSRLASARGGAAPVVPPRRRRWRAYIALCLLVLLLLFAARRRGKLFGR